MRQIKNLLLAGAIVASFVSCRKESSGAESKFTVRASCPETRTYADGYSVHWAPGDRIALFHLASGTSDYVADGMFTFDGDGTFSGDVPSGLASSNDWYAVYPYTYENNNNHGNYAMIRRDISTVPVLIGGRTGNPQIQTGNGTGNIAGVAAPLYGSVTDVPAEETPDIVMHQAAAVLSVDVTNASDSPFIVTGVEFTAPCDIVGQYIIDTSGDTPLYSAMFDGALSSTAVLQVNGGTPLASGATASFYILTAPFTASQGDRITLKIKSDSGLCEKEISLSKDFVFSAGRVKHLSVSCDAMAAGSWEDGTPELLAGTMTFNDSEDDPKLSFVTGSGITVVQSKGTASKSGYPQAKYNSLVNNFRVYQGNELNFSGKTFTKIEFVYSDDYRPTEAVVFEGGGSYTTTQTAVDGNGVTRLVSGYWTGESDSVTFKWKPQVRFVSISLTYKVFVAGGNVEKEVTDIITGPVTGQTDGSYKDWPAPLELVSGATYSGNHRYSYESMMFKGNNTGSRVYNTAAGLSDGYVDRIVINGSYCMNGNSRRFKVYVADEPILPSADVSALACNGEVVVDQGKTSVYTLDGNWRYFMLTRSNGSDANIESIAICWRNYTK